MIPQSRRRWSKSTIRTIILSTAIVWLMCFVLTSVLILGAGVMPVHPYVLGLLLLTIALAYSLAADSIPQRRMLTPFLQAALLFVCFAATFQMFSCLVDGAIAHAQAFGAEVAEAARICHDRTGRWPESLAEIPQDIRPRIGRVGITPYIADDEPDEYGNSQCIAGLFVTYDLTDSGPRLTVGRRSMRWRWEWEKSTWVKSDPN